MSDYLLQIINKSTGQVVHSWAPGMAVERQFEEELVNRVRAKGVGLFRTEAHVIADFQAAFREMLYELKAQV